MRNVAVILFDRVEVLDFAGPFEVFSVCGRSGGATGYFNAYTVAEHSPVVARNGLTVTPHFLLQEAPQPDLFIVPGGGGFTADGTPFGTRKEMHNQVLLDWIIKHNTSAELVLSVCTGSLILARTGLLDGLSATTHWRAVDQLREAAPNTTVIDDRRWVDNGRIVTAAGVSAGIDMSLYVVGKLLGAQVARDTARYMEYDHWTQ